nr:MAG TPA: hypothetical protein [Caudoviricetes sp.]
MEKIKEIKKPVMPILKNMAVGESVLYPCSRMNTVKSVVSQMQVTMGIKFRTKLEKPNIRVTRTE